MKTDAMIETIAVVHRRAQTGANVFADAEFQKFGIE
jgi:hypothetical protein